MPLFFNISVSTLPLGPGGVCRLQKVYTYIIIEEHSREDFAAEGGVCVFDRERERGIGATLDQILRVKQLVSGHSHHFSSSVPQNCHLVVGGSLLKVVFYT